MSDVTYEAKAEVIDEVLPICDLLKEHHEKLSALPRTTTASRQLAVIINKLEGWHQSFTLTPSTPSSPPTLDKSELMREIEELIDSRINC